MILTLSPIASHHSTEDSTREVTADTEGEAGAFGLPLCQIGRKTKKLRSS